MDEQIKEHYVLLVKEPGAEQVKAVVGVDEAGKLKTAAPTPEHQTTFLKIDKHSSAVENLLSNFMRQQKNPTHFGFFKVPAARLLDVQRLCQEMSLRRIGRSLYTTY